MDVPLKMRGGIARRSATRVWWGLGGAGLGRRLETMDGSDGSDGKRVFSSWSAVEHWKNWRPVMDGGETKTANHVYDLMDQNHINQQL